MNVQHCGVSVSKQCSVVLNLNYVAKALPVKYQITAHRLCMAYSKFVTINSIVMLAKRRACHGVVQHNGAIFLPLRSYSGCWIHRLSLNTATQSLLDASLEIAKGSRHASASLPPLR